ncbi:hypothetical protein [Erwinia phage FBB1]|nr:hypothetical protein [Erwinia phage FBB1]
MVAKNIMASFGQGFVQTQIMAENNAVKYKLSFAGSNKNSTAFSYCQINDKDIGSTSFGVGLNTKLINLSNNSVVDEKYFDFKNSSGSSQAFINYVAGLQSGLILVMFSNSELGSDTNIDNWFNSVGSVAWPNTSKLQKFPTTSYAAIYLTGEKLICKEACIINDGIYREDSRAFIDTVYDKIEDLGATGYPYRFINDPNTYSSSSDYELKRYPDDSLTTPIKNAGVGDKFMIFSADLFADNQLISDGMTTRIVLRWLNDNNVISSTTLETSTFEADRWITKGTRVVIPATANNFTVVANRYPQGSTSTGVGSVRNVFLARISKQFENLDRPSEIGVNGIRMNQFIDDSSSFILELVDTNTDSTGTVYGTEFKEFSR